MPKVFTRVKLRKLACQVWNPEIRDKLRNTVCAQMYPTDNSYADNSGCDDGWSHDEWNDDWSSVGWHEGWDQTCDDSTSSFSLGSLDLGVMSSPKRFEWVKMNLDTKAAVNTCSLNFGSDGAGDAEFCRTASD